MALTCPTLTAHRRANDRVCWRPRAMTLRTRLAPLHPPSP